MSTPDQIDGAPHPRDTATLFGQDTARQTFLEAYAAGRLHHAWLLTGPRGVGKATLAWQMARFLLATPAQQDDGLFGAPPPPETLDIDSEHPVVRRIAAGAEPGLKVITRTPNPNTDRMRDQIVVDDIRSLAGFFQLSATDGGRRVVIVDAADEMNSSAANALLKMLEEPPERATLLLISHRPSGLLPTIRSRCRSLRLGTLAPDDMARAFAQAGFEVGTEAPALAELSGGSLGAALRLSLLEGLKTYADLVTLIGTLPRLDRQAAVKLAEAASARGSEAKRDLLFELIDLALSRLARTGATGSPPSVEAAPREAETFARLAPNAHAGRAWAQIAQETGARVQHGIAVNLDPAALVLDTLIKLSQTADA
ncbi:DNA polymerase III subunit delta' [uncultured Roseobacter sp.]|uniref:DNA polymerase III subunit delta' n=1 Tax=uncultured Roseobacter sp. TaxID=114847 RepID=UPI002633AD6A|nr:DNA polymerase III subunit delta' [uncultured Roseobacter sp.]